MFYAAGPVESAITNRSLGVVPTDTQQRMVGYGSFDAVMDVLERAVSANPFITGDRFTAADVYAGSQILFGLQFGSLPKRDAFIDYAARLTKRPAYIQAAALDDALIGAAA